LVIYIYGYIYIYFLGGNNFYGQELADNLLKLSEVEASAYILMERIFPPEQTAVMVRDGLAVERLCLSELGIYGCYLSDGKDALLNKYGGFLLRVKPSSADEGGVAAGYAVLGCPHIM
jgi:glutathione synthase